MFRVIFHFSLIFVKSFFISKFFNERATAMHQLEYSPLLYLGYLIHLPTRHDETMACEEETRIERSFTTLKSFNNMKAYCVVHVSFLIGFDFVFQTVSWRLSLAIVDNHNSGCSYTGHVYMCNGRTQNHEYVCYRLFGQRGCSYHPHKAKALGSIF